jgi:hypothetical protein
MKKTNKQTNKNDLPININETTRINIAYIGNKKKKEENKQINMSSR